MKKVLFIVALAAFASSCKKNHTDVAPVQQVNRVKQVELKNYPHTSNFSYDVKGNLVSYTTSDNMKRNYDYSNGFSAKVYFSAAEIDNEFISTSIQNGRVVSGKYNSYFGENLSTSSDHVFEYSPEGYLLKKTESYFKRVYEYNNGNLAKISVYGNGVLAYTETFEYYTDLENKFNINVIDSKHSIVEVNAGIFGKANKNLLKKAVKIQAAKNITTDYVYSLNPQGIVTGYTVTKKENQNLPETLTYTITYQ